jgi:hypothetical protein
MRLFVGPLSESAGQKDVRDFIETGIRPRGPLAFLNKTTGRVSCTMMEVPGREGRGPIYFAIVHIHPASLAKKAITNLNGSTIRSRAVAVREFIERDPGSERRRRPSSAHPRNQRSLDRRGYAVFRVCGSARQLTIVPVKGYVREYAGPVKGFVREYGD